MSERRDRFESIDYCGLGKAVAALDDDLPEPPATARSVVFQAPTPLVAVRTAVGEEAARAGLAHTQIEDLVVAVNEVATNSLRYGGGGGTLRIWDEGDGVGLRRARPGTHRRSPRRAGATRRERRERAGLWLVNQLCDLVQIRSRPAGTVVRLRMTRTGENPTPR